MQLKDPDANELHKDRFLSTFLEPDLSAWDPFIKKIIL